MANQRAESIMGHEKWLAKHRERYRQVTKVLEDKKEVRRLFLITIPNAIQELIAYDPSKHPSDMAVAACAKAQLRFATLLGDVEFIETYEERREILENLEAQAEIAEEGNPATEDQRASADFDLPG